MGVRARACVCVWLRVVSDSNSGSDPGSEKVWIYGFDPVLGTLSAEPTALDLPHGSGPRHCDFHPSGAFLYITCELDGTVVVASCDESKGALFLFQVI